MPDEEVPQETEVDRATVELNTGIKSCQAVVASYRAMIADALGDSHAADPVPEPSNGRPG